MDDMIKPTKEEIYNKREEIIQVALNSEAGKKALADAEEGMKKLSNTLFNKLTSVKKLLDFS